ncbi:MAG: DUF5678 domain-containing protein [Anaerolineae bacterium]|nr:DUF5678 domain-containing protein [Anaerolineae bacterium]
MSRTSKGAQRARETRVVYRARTRKPIKRQVVRSSKSSATRSVAVPWEARIAPTAEQVRDWDAWLNEHEPEFEEKYPGRYLAIWDRQVIAIAPTRAELYALADRVKPEVIPLVTYVPRAEDIRILPSNFPIDWNEEANVKRQ